MADNIHTIGFTILGEIPPIVREQPATVDNPINIFPVDSGGGKNLDGFFQSIGGDVPPPPPPPVYRVVLNLSPEQREPGQGSSLTVQVEYDEEPILDVFTVSLTSSNQSVAPVPSTLITDNRGVVLMEILATSIGVTTITASVTIDGVVYTSNQVTFLVITPDARENYDATGYGVIKLTLENTLSRGTFPNPQRLSHEEQIRKYPDDTGLRRVAYFANAELVFIPSFPLK